MKLYLLLPLYIISLVIFPWTYILILTGLGTLFQNSIYYSKIRWEGMVGKIEGGGGLREGDAMERESRRGDKGKDRNAYVL